MGIVPTTYEDRTVAFFGGYLYTNQYAVTEFSHAVDPEKPDALPGIFIKYDLEALSVKVIQSRRGIIQFLTRSFGVIGGTFPYFLGSFIRIGVFTTFGICLRLYLFVQGIINNKSSGPKNEYQRL